ncbi:MAG: leucine-rich repeat domain-containing protein [Patescibacteria group bacterium]|jgi:uncharacterized protein YkwD|nr:leucine-rich repeat domain-containing protein [Patescibacteria group bacterium]
MNKNLIILGLTILLVFLSYGIISNKNDNSNSVISDIVDVKIVNAPKTKNEILDLSGQGLEKLPEYVLGMRDLKELNLSDNNLEGALPSQIGKLKNLEKLNVSNNDMTGIPAEIGQLEKLEELNYANNEITGLPLELAKLKNLKEFNLSGNDYSEYDMEKIKEDLPNLIVKDDKIIEEAKVEPSEVKVVCNTGSFDEQFLCMLNEYRKQNGKSSLSYDSKLNTVALNHSTWMNVNGEFSHAGDGGSSFSERCSTAGTICDAENLAFGVSTAQKLFDMWKNSPAHNKNMLGDHAYLGIGLNSSYTTAVFK